MPIIDSPNPCLECGKTFKAPRKQFNHGRKFCDIKCAGIYHGRQKIRNLVNCLCCGKVFRGRTRDQVTSRGNKFCSSQCRQTYKGILKTCPRCDKRFVSYYKYTYCSRECYELENAAKLVHHNCAVCGVDIVRLAALDLRKGTNPSRRRFCSRECQHIGLSGKNHPLYLGVRKANRGGSWNRQRKMMKSKYQHCRFCDGEVAGRTSHVDHIVPFKESRFGGNDPNGEDNLWVLCRSCHRKKTTIERILYSEGKDMYIEKIVELSGIPKVRQELETAFKYCQLPKQFSCLERTFGKGKTGVEFSFSAPNGRHLPDVTEQSVQHTPKVGAASLVV